MGICLVGVRLVVDLDDLHRVLEHRKLGCPDVG
jgi:hypothetical protein